MTITIRLINDASIAPKDFDTITQVVQHFVPLVTTAWNIPDVVVVNGGTPVAGDWLVYATEKNRRVGAGGYHETKAGVPVAYCSPRASGRLFGAYIKALVIKGKQIHGAIYTPGLATVLCHEIAEMLCDPQIATISSVDSKGRNWLVEVCDHCFGSYSTIVINGINCILPDVTTPSFYNTAGTAPYSILGACPAPFTMTPKGYAYYKDEKGMLIKI
jgi:hypothetical protein